MLCLLLLPVLASLQLCGGGPLRCTAFFPIVYVRIQSATERGCMWLFKLLLLSLNSGETLMKGKKEGAKSAYVNQAILVI